MGGVAHTVVVPPQPRLRKGSSTLKAYLPSILSHVMVLADTARLATRTHAIQTLLNISKDPHGMVGNPNPNIFFWFKDRGGYQPAREGRVQTKAYTFATLVRLRNGMEEKKVQLPKKKRGNKQGHGAMNNMHHLHVRHPGTPYQHPLPE